MNNRLAYLAILFLAGFSYQADSGSLVLPEDVAKAYVQAITNGPGSKVAGSIDYDALGCTAATVFDEQKCQKIVFNGKDGKTLLMEMITASNIADLVPIDDIRRVYGNDPQYQDVRQIFFYLSTKNSGWYAYLEGDTKAKAILQRHLESTGPGGMYGDFVWPFDASDPQKAKITSAGIDFMIKTLPSATALDANKFPLYYWALQTNFSDMAYPRGFDFAGVSGIDANRCKDTTTAWGHVGLQYLKNNPSLPNNAQRQANWGGGGDGSGNDDYGCGGSDVTKLNWKANVWYEYRVTRAVKRAPKLWEWVGEIYKKGEAAPVYSRTIFGGEYVTYATTWAELINISCTDPKLITQWANPWMGNASGKFRVGRISLNYGGDACLRSKEIIADQCHAKWTQNQGAVSPVGHAGANLLRKSNQTDLFESYCQRTPDATEKAIAKAYVQAISGGSGAKRVSGSVDFIALDCKADTVWDEAKCQAAVFNGKDGKTVLMEAITSVADGNWLASNIKSIIPEDAMTRIMTDPQYAQAKDILINMATPTNGWYDYLEGQGKAKDVLLQYMNSIH
ncbi:MAG: hypothetical protein Q7U57_13345 [Methylovulum sp.]|nr:hypothetical protein [Methylovulum sp.]